jgi:hypothetical protein
MRVGYTARMSTQIRRLVQRDRLLAARVSTRELERAHRAARAVGIPLAELVRDAVRCYARELDREHRDDGARS